MKEFPQISIMTVSFNQGWALEKALCSVLDQGYPNLQYIVIDGGSRDNSVEILRKYEQRLAYWVSEPDRGQSHALNKGFARCSGDLLGWLCSDDFLLPGALARFAEAWQEDPRAGAWVGDANLVDPAGKVLKVQQPGKLDRESLADWEVNGFSQPACLFAKSAWDKCGPINESLFVAMDFDLWLKIAERFPFKRIPATLAGAIVHPAAKTQAYVHLKHAEVWQVLMRRGFDDLAKRKMLAKLGEIDELRRKVDKLTNLPIYRLIRPMVKKFLGKPTKAGD
jgi:glycosyltransferase involved in cell wall biosynthesis